ncbi:hypothetical protein [Nocardioides campestrisoli]|uniref:hypothetical protein n=1 Tax=Nocardioides campestrisoli TaxID=2736757 RepID=UPI0015E65C8C|nr:hypothetical protein [Nocardioides campestrisoli]
MTPPARTLVRREWAGLNVALLLGVLWLGGLHVGLILLLGTDHSQAYVVEELPLWGAGALAGMLVALLASRYDRRYLPWVVPAALVGLMSAPTTTFPADHPLIFALGPLLSLSVVLNAWTERACAPAPIPRGHLWGGGAATALTMLLVGAATAYVVVASRPTPAYEAMRADPVATTRLPGMELVADHSKDSTTTLAFPSPAEVSRLWRITDGSASRAKLEQLEDLAPRHGWTAGAGGSWCAWQKTVAGSPLCLSIGHGFEPGQVRVEITLREY